MDEKKFIEDFANQFEDSVSVGLNLQTEFRTVSGWSSLVALSVMAMCSAEYNVIISADEMENAEKISDIYNIVKLRFNG